MGRRAPFLRLNGQDRDALPPELRTRLPAKVGGRGNRRYRSPIGGGFMSRQFAFAAPMIALAVLSVSTIFPSSSYAAETCLAAPQGTAPQGSHWYYRLDRATQRKCWRLVKLDGQPRRTAKQVAPPPQPVEEENAPATQTSVERIPQSAPQQGWLTRSASAVPEAIAPP